jgi:GNAT superfamily N-acetyltransferase
MENSLLLRDLVKGDLEPLLALYSELHPGDEPIDPARAEAIWSAILANPDHICLGGFVGDELVTSCAVAIVANLTRGGRPYAVIENVVTSSARRRKGYASALLWAAIDRCWLRDCYKVMLMSAAGRTEAHSFYESLGFDRQSKQAFVLKRS